MKITPGGHAGPVVVAAILKRGWPVGNIADTYILKFLSRGLLLYRGRRHYGLLRREACITNREPCIARGSLNRCSKVKYGYPRMRNCTATSGPPAEQFKASPKLRS